MTLVEFIRAMPESWPHPDRNIVLSEDKDGWMYDLDWDFGKHKIASISICDNGDIVWSYICGSKRDYGMVLNPKKMPKEIIAMFKEFGVR